MTRSIFSKRLALICALSSVFLISGCSWLPSFGSSGSKTYSYKGKTKPVNECTFNVKSCMYEGPYEPGERQFALEEARRLNAASLEQLRRNAVDLN